MHNLRTVIKFETVRTLKKKSFWIAALAIPVAGALIGMIVYFSNKTTDTLSQQLSQAQYSVAITDDSHIIAPKILSAIHAQTVPSKQAGIDAVKNGQLDAYFYYPQDISKGNVEVYGKEVGLFDDSRYQSLAQDLLKQSIAATTNANVRAVLQDRVAYNATTFKDGQQDKGFLKLIAPGMFLVLFYFMLVTFGNQILTSITEEKENRVIEMILTTIKPTTLLVGKLLSLTLLAFIQLVTILTPLLIGYFILKDQLSLPSLDLSSIPFDPLAITLGAVIFVISFFMYTGILMTLGAAMPTAKEASSFFGMVMLFTFGPLYASSLFISSPNSTIVQVLSYFPLTSPIPLLLRNAVGNLTLPQAVIGIALLITTTIIAIRIGVRIFKFGALEYSRRLSLSEVIKRKN